MLPTDRCDAVQGRVLRRVMFRNGKLKLFDAHVEHVGLAVMSGLVEHLAIPPRLEKAVAAATVALVAVPQALAPLQRR